MSPSQAFALRFIFPATVGALIAVTVLLLAPHWIFPATQPTGVSSNVGVPMATPTVTSSKAGPVSYAHAVNLAAPAVVNIYTRRTVARKTSP